MNSHDYPLYNEQEIILRLCGISASVASISPDFILLFVDDGAKTILWKR